MSVHTIARPVRDLELDALLAVHLVAPAAVERGPDAVTYTFTPDLTAGQAETLASLVRYCRADLSITAAEYLALEPVLVGLRTYRGLASPTNAQSVAAIKGIVDVLRALLRD